MNPGEETPNKDIKIIRRLIGDLPSSWPQLKGQIRELSENAGLQSGINLLYQVEVSHKLRKPRLAIFDHTGHMIGGGQKYGFTIAHALQDIFEVTLLLNRDITIRQLQKWYDLDLSKCQLKIIKIPFFDQFDSPHLDPARISGRMGNPFHAVSLESGNHDFFINNSMNEMVYPMSNLSYIICHFPERRPKNYFYADLYSGVIYNSEYTAHWIEQRWKFKPHKHIYPPVDMEIESPAQAIEKENIILSVARFEEGGSKKQLEMLRVFLKLNQQLPDILKNWQLVFVGGSPDDNPYLLKLKELIKVNKAENVRLEINIPGQQLKKLYRKAKVFWHLCGLQQTDPALVEHFGMTIVEAMQNGLVPIVFDGGGQREIVEQGINGYRIDSSASLIQHSTKLFKNPVLLEKMSQQAQIRGKVFSRSNFETRVRDYFNQQLNKYITVQDS